jgi:hypothetical protein
MGDEKRPTGSLPVKGDPVGISAYPMSNHDGRKVRFSRLTWLTA